MDQNNPLQQNLQREVTYLLCPDRECKLYYDTSSVLACESNCPKQDELVKIIVCHGCNEAIELAGDHHKYQRVDHACPTGSVAANFRMSGRYFLLYELPG